MRIPRKLPVAAALVALAMTSAAAAEPAFTGELSASKTEFKYEGGPIVGFAPTAEINEANPCGGPGHGCEDALVKIGATGQMAIKLVSDTAEADLDLELFKSDDKGEVSGAPLKTSNGFQVDEAISHNAKAGEFYVIRVNSSVAPGTTYTVTATLKPSAAAPAPAPGATPTPAPTPAPSPEPGKLPASGPLTADAAVDKGKRSSARTKGIRTRVRCSVICKAKSVASVDGKTAKKLGLGSKATIIAAGEARIDKPGRIPYFAKPTPKAKKALAKKVKGLKRINVTVVIQVTDDQGGQLKRFTQRITLR